jgi:hypothetical protein
MGVKVGAAVFTLALTAGASASTPGKTQHFKSFIRTARQVPASYPPNAPAGATAFVATDANEGDFFRVALSPEANAKLDAFRFEHRFLIGVLLTTKTTGYATTIESIRLQRPAGGKRQFCITAAIRKPKPGAGVVHHLWFAMHVVSLSADPYRIDEFHWNIPKAWVLRDTHNKLLAVSHEGKNQQGKPITTGKATACRA